MVSAHAEAQQGYLNEKGNASDSVRAEVLTSLREFQDGYSKRDPKQLDVFMQRLFPSDQDTRVIGADANEWRTGYDSIARFIKDDWLEWGDVRLAVDNSVISSSDNVAWLATTGKVVWAHSSRPIRFTAVLTRRNGRWIFRQTQFQWDERPLRFSDLMRKEGWSQLNFR
jgi:SnoaL-like domain